MVANSVVFGARRIPSVHIVPYISDMTARNWIKADPSLSHSHTSAAIIHCTYITPGCARALVRSLHVLPSREDYTDRHPKFHFADTDRQTIHSYI